MQAVSVFPGSREVRLTHHPEPRISADRDVKLRMLEVGVCGTDRDLCAFRFGSPPGNCDHFILGHESLAEVVEVGDGVSSLKHGDLVVAGVRKPCGDPDCDPCRAGRQDFCATGHYRERGIVGMHGFMTEFVIEEEHDCYIVPSELGSVAVLAEPLTIAEKAFEQWQAIDNRLPWRKEQRTAAVLGAGPVGLLGAMLFRAAGLNTWVYSRELPGDARAKIVESVGAQYCSSTEVRPEEFVRAAGNLQVVYEAMGAAQTAFDVLECLGANGVFVFTGVPAASKPLTLHLHQLLRQMIVRNQVVIGTVNAGAGAYHAAVRDLTDFHRRWPRAVESLISARYPLERFREAIDDPGIKNVIEIR